VGNVVKGDPDLINTPQFQTAIDKAKRALDYYEQAYNYSSLGKVHRSDVDKSVAQLYTNSTESTYALLEGLISLGYGDTETIEKLRQMVGDTEQAASDAVSASQAGDSGSSDDSSSHKH
jgi:hypothetical protein